MNFINNNVSIWLIHYDKCTLLIQDVNNGKTRCRVHSDSLAIFIIIL